MDFSPWAQNQLVLKRLLLSPLPSLPNYREKVEGLIKVVSIQPLLYCLGTSP